MAKNDLLKEAIADAKAVRETALANAKIALEEAFTPRIQSMLSAKLAEDEEMDEMAEDPIETNGDGMDAAAGSPVDEAEADATVEVEPVTDEEPAYITGVSQRLAHSNTLIVVIGPDLKVSTGFLNEGAILGSAAR